MDFIINHSRFKKKFVENELTFFLDKQNRIKRFPQYEKKIFDFFNLYAKKNYKLIENICLCKSRNDILLSLTDRTCLDFVTVVCKNCGLIRAKKYYRDEDVNDFYKNFYRKVFGEYPQPDDFFNKQKIDSKLRFNLLNEYKNQELRNLKIVDIGGGVGGILDHFDKSNSRYLYDFYDPYLDYAKSKGINSIKGGLEEIDFQPDIIILSHVIEHWSNFEKEIENLIKVQKKNKTLNYIEFPGVDSLKEGRREGDILGDIHVPHVYYFSSYVFENIMNRYGFEKVYIDNMIRSIFIYTGIKKKLINFYDQCYKDLWQAEKTRKRQIFKNIIKYFTPHFLIKLIRKLKTI